MLTLVDDDSLATVRRPHICTPSFQVLNGFYDAIRMVVRENLEKATLFQALPSVLMILDEVVDGGYVNYPTPDQPTGL
jgi:hypothetical protein